MNRSLSWIVGFSWPQHTCVDDCVCQRQWPDTAKPFLVMRYRDHSCEFAAATLANAQAYIAAFKLAHVYIWNTLTNDVL